MNRAQRRQAERNQRYDARAAYRALPMQERMELDLRINKKRELERNGITIKDLEENFNRGFKEGVNQSTDMVTRAAYAAAILALRQTYRFGTKRLLRFLTAMDDNIVSCVDRDDIVEKCWNDAGIKLVDGEGVERIQAIKG